MVMSGNDPASPLRGPCALAAVHFSQHAGWLGAGVLLGAGPGALRGGDADDGAEPRHRAVPHGFRSSFRDWAAERSDAPREVCELALAHVNTNAIEAAYRRTDLFERRRDLMEQWAAFLAGSGAARGANGGAALPS